MKRMIPILTSMMLTATSCDSLMNLGYTGGIRVEFDETALPLTRSDSYPDTNGFILKVSDSKGNAIYEGSYGAAPEVISASPGQYTVETLSCEFSSPLFDKPQYGDTKSVVVKSNETSTALMQCSQLNCGIKLNIDSRFPTEYPNGVLYLKSNTGKLMYSFTEKRTAYFQPGSISTILSDGATDQTLFTRTLAARQMLLINLTIGNDPNSSTGTRIQVQIDTTRNWSSEDYRLGGGGEQGGTEKSAMSVTQARSAAGKEDVWVYGYIVGGDLSSSKCSFETPFSSRTNLVIAAKSSCKDKQSCLSVQLAKGDIRDELNLVDHPDLLGRQVFLKGDIVEAYYGIPGIQSLTEYELK